MRRKLLKIFLFLCSCSILLSCNSTRTLTNGEFLVNRNRVKVDNKKISLSDVDGYIKQKPNRKILGVLRINVAVYNIFKSGKKDRKWKQWLYNTIGEAPVILDTLLTNKSVIQIKLYLGSKGYFNSEVSKEIAYKKKKANISYIIHSTQPYSIKKLKYSIHDDLIKSIVFHDTINSLIIPGNNYDADVLQSERERITTDLKNDGYYNFTKDFITYNVDSAFGKHQLEVTMLISDPVVKQRDGDTIVTATHKRFKIDNINIYTGYKSTNTDTTKYKKYRYFAPGRKKKDNFSEYNFLFKNTLRIKPKTVTQAIFINPGDYYQVKNVDLTYSSLMGLKMYKFINIQFTESQKDTAEELNLLDCNIQLSRTPVQSFSVETEATNSEGNLGVSGDFLYSNKNVFRGAEIFNFKINGAMEVQKVLGEKNSSIGIKQVLPFNTIETGVQVGFDIPKFLIPIRQESFSKYFKPKTTISTGLDYEKRPDYTRYIANITYGYEWKESPEKKWIIYPADINSVKIYPSANFLNTINSINDPKIKNSYQDHMIMAGKFSFIFNNQHVGKERDFSYFKGNGEWSGNILRAYNSLMNNYRFADGSYTVFNIKYAQYARADADYRHYFVINKSERVVFRAFCGYGIAYGNSTVLPFEKSFFAGGANSVRGWRVYTLGPGSFHDTANSKNVLDKTGDIDIEGNLEYRFPIYNFLKGALFVDGGNVWLNKKNPQMPGGEFEINRFYREFALSVGFGVRFDFSFFVLRLDIAQPLRDPANPENQRWVLGDAKFGTLKFNIGIGYPF